MASSETASGDLLLREFLFITIMCFIKPIYWLFEEKKIMSINSIICIEHVRIKRVS